MILLRRKRKHFFFIWKGRKVGIGLKQRQKKIRRTCFNMRNTLVDRAVAHTNTYECHKAYIHIVIDKI